MRYALAALVSALSFVSACGDAVSPMERDERAAEARWNSSRPLGNSYRMQQQVSCFCIFGGTSYQVTVSNGVITRVVDLSTQKELATSEFARFRTVDQLFAEARSAMQVPGMLREVKYHAQRGYPLTVSLDPIRNAVDDEVVYFTAALVDATS